MYHFFKKLKSVGKELIRELDELRLSGKSEDEMAKNIGQMAKKWVEAHNFRKFDGQLDKKQWDKAKQCLEKKMEEMVSVEILNMQIIKRLSYVESYSNSFKFL